MSENEHDKHPQEDIHQSTKQNTAHILGGQPDPCGEYIESCDDNAAIKARQSRSRTTAS